MVPVRMVRVDPGRGPLPRYLGTNRIGGDRMNRAQGIEAARHVLAGIMADRIEELRAVVCDTCGVTVGEGAACWYMATPVCPACWHIDNGDPVCGDCSPDIGDGLEWADDMASGADVEPCAVCGNGGQA